MKYVGTLKFDLYLIKRLGDRFHDFNERVMQEPEVARLWAVQAHYSRCLRSEMNKANEIGDYEAVGRFMDEIRPHSIRANRAYQRAAAALLSSEPTRA